jgi:hypothetical protein
VVASEDSLEVGGPKDVRTEAGEDVVVRTEAESA